MANTPLNNTFKHISDESRYTYFDPTGTTFPPTVKTVQEALAMTSPTAPATEAQAGVIAIATQAEVIAGTVKNKAVTPATLAERLKYPDATAAVKGIVFLATNAEAQAGTISTNKAINPASLKHTMEWYWTNRTATESANGVVKLSTQAAAQAGVDDTTAMTPLKVKQAIFTATSNLPIPAAATESAQGMVRLATVNQTAQGILRDGYAISPYTLMQLKGNTSRFGVARAATVQEALAGGTDELYISANGFRYYNGSPTAYGTVKLTTSVDGGGTGGVALASNAAVLATNYGGEQAVAGTINFTGTLRKNGSDVATIKNITDSMPAGSVQMWMGDNEPPGGLWKMCYGDPVNKNTYPALFAAIGYRFGGAGDWFNLPDMRGLFTRGAHVSEHILRERGRDGKNKLKLGEGVAGGAPGFVQKQQLIQHKHVMMWGERYSRWDSWAGATVSPGKNGARGGQDWDNFHYFTNDANEIEAYGNRDEHATLNPEGLIGLENRPWNMSVNYIIKVV